VVTIRPIALFCAITCSASLATGPGSIFFKA
jgi:hypothetical protein